jgi:hypothetical protein
VGQSMRSVGCTVATVSRAQYGVDPNCDLRLPMIIGFWPNVMTGTGVLTGVRAGTRRR